MFPLSIAICGGCKFSDTPNLKQTIIRLKRTSAGNRSCFFRSSNGSTAYCIYFHIFSIFFNVKPIWSTFNNPSLFAYVVYHIFLLDQNDVWPSFLSLVQAKLTTKHSIAGQAITKAWPLRPLGDVKIVKFSSKNGAASAGRSWQP